jgi:hypothetical protein
MPASGVSKSDGSGAVPTPIENAGAEGTPASRIVGGALGGQ